MTKKEIFDYLEPINTNHIEAAMRQIDLDGIPSGRSSQMYSVISPLNGTKYPPPYLIELAFKLATGNELPTGFFSKITKDGGHFEKLKSLGCKIVDKNDPVFELIESYKTHIRESELKDELYKWDLIQKFKGRPDVNAPDFAEELRSINYGNFLYAMSNGVLRGLVKQDPEEMRQNIKDLLNENLPLKERIEEYGKSTFDLYRRLEPDNKTSHHQDERTAATILSFFNPDKYTLYKSSFYVKYCEFLGLKQKNKGEKYIHYLELIHDFVNNYILKDAELLELVDSFLPSTAYPDSQRIILAQDILYHHFNKNNTVDLFQILEQFIAQAKTGDLKTSSYPKKYEGLTTKVSFGQGVSARIPWMSLTKEPNTTSKGIYPVFLYYKEFEKLVLAYGISETEVSDFEWTETEGLQTINEWYLESFQKRPDRYGASYLKGIYDTTDLNRDQIMSDLEEIIDSYNSIDFKLSDNSETAPTIIKTTMAQPLNQILYGPPGTGKTYNSIDEALKIVDSEFYKANKENRGKLVERFNELIFDENLNPSGLIVFTTFHQSLAYEDFIEGIKPVMTGNGELEYEIKDGLFKQVVNLAKRNTSSNFSDAYTNLIKDINDNDADYLTLKTIRGKEYRVNVNSNNNLSLFTSIEIKKQGVLSKDKLMRFYNGEKNVFDGWEGYATGVIEYLKSNYQLSNEKISNELNNYVIIIDEINRGNVSSIFGELITLIEDDKRIGKLNHLSVVLPYSREQFSIPQNLFIIGTMNTADRSVESLDTALRRRFSFLEMLPDPSNLIDKNNRPLNVKDINLQDLLFTINKRIEFLVDRDHTIGHAFFIGVNSIAALKSTFKNKIIPLLQEYFYGNYYNIELVLGSGFFNKKAKSQVSFAMTNAEVDTEGFIYDFIDFETLNEDEFIKLMNDIKIESYTK